MPTRRERLEVIGDRKSIRKQVIIKFLEEEPGTGKGDLCSKYIYEVENLADGRKILLKRPASLNKGVDFTVHIENARFGNRGAIDMPSHSDIFQDLLEKKSSNPIDYEKVKALIHKLYNCENLESQDYDILEFRTGYSIESILKAIKWLFIEQDVTYWNWSGRNMLFSALQSKGLC